MKNKLAIMIFSFMIMFGLCGTNVYANQLTARGGVCYNDYGYKETYYNLPMERVVSIMREKGYSEKDYPYWIREDGVKMFGGMVMVAADLNQHPKGDIVNTSLGLGIVVDTGSAIKGNKIDIATSW